MSEWLVRIEAGRAVAEGPTAEVLERGGAVIAAAASTSPSPRSRPASSLVALAIGVSYWRGTGLENEIAVAVLRSFIQLIAIGYVIQAIFDEDSIWLVIALLAVMVGFGAFTARRRAKRVPGALWPLVVALGDRRRR